MHLYLDTSHFLSVGLLDDNFKWLHFEHHEKLQHSADIHAQIFEILKKFNVEALDLKSVFLCNGPGSYTGIRLGEGIAQLFELSQIPVYSFHQYEIAKILGVNEGQWVCHAFKKEVFNYFWNDEKVSSELIAADEWVKVTSALYTHQPSGPWESFKPILTTELLRDNPAPIFGHLKNNKIRRESYYFRPLDKEFKRSVV